MTKFITSAALSLVAFSAFAAQEQKPNILWIITDDHRADALECFNQAHRGTNESALGYVSSPSLNKLAAEGVLFARSFCNSPLSGPSRASMHTGLYPHHNGMFNFQLKHNEHDQAQPIVPELMREAGYSTAAFGKLGYYIYKQAKPMTYKYPDSHYEQMASERDIEKAQIADFSYPFKSKNGKSLIKREQWNLPSGEKIAYDLFQKPVDDTPENIAVRDKFRKDYDVIVRPNNAGGEIIAGVSPMPTEKTEDGRILELFEQYLDNANKPYKAITGKMMQGADSSKPLFVNLGFHFPHTPVMPSKEYRDKFKNKKYDIPIFEQWEYEKMSEQMQKWSKLTSMSSFSAKQKQQLVQDYYAFCAMGDALIGEAVDKFKAYSEANNQPYMIVFACGDHGWHLGEQGSYFKCTGFLKSNETAIIVVSSDKEKFPAGKVVMDYAEYVDFAPTFYSAAGYDLENERFDFLDGRDLQQTAQGKVEGRDYVIGEVQALGGGLRAFIRTEDFAFSMKSRKNSMPSRKNMPNEDVKWAMECSPEEANMGLYDLRVDPMERNNLAYDAKYQALAEWFRVKLGNIVLGDGRFEAIWDEKNTYNVSNFALGSDDKKIEIPSNIIPKVKVK